MLRLHLGNRLGYLGVLFRGAVAHLLLLGMSVWGAPEPPSLMLAFACDDGVDLEICGITNAGAQVQLTDNGRDDAEPALSADGRVVAYLCDDADGRAQVCVVRSDGTGMRALTSGGRNRAPTISGGGVWVAYNCAQRRFDRALCITHTEGMEAQRLTPATQTTAQAPRFSDDGSIIVFGCRRTETEDEPQHTICLVQPDGAGYRELPVRAGLPFAPDLVQWPVPSVDGRWIAYECIDTQTLASHVCLFDLATGEARRLTPEVVASARYSNPTITADGRRIVYRCEDELCLSDVEGGNRSVLTDDELFNTSPELSADGSLVAYACHDEGATLGLGSPSPWRVCLLEIESGQHHRFNRSLVGAPALARGASAESLALD